MRLTPRDGAGSEQINDRRSQADGGNLFEPKTGGCSAMTVVARKFISVPVRSARETWSAICGILAADGNSEAARELLSVSGVASSLIAREAMTSPIVVHGSGPRVRIYCLYHADAIDGDDSNESDLIFDATDGDWKMSLPCPTDDLDWVQAELAG